MSLFSKSKGAGILAKSNLGLVATEDLFLDRAQTGIVRLGDPRAAFLLARKGGIIPTKVSLRLGLSEATTLSDESPAAPPTTTSPEDISERSTRPEKPHRTR